MIESKYGKVLTVILVIVVIGVLILLGFLGYDVYKKYTSDKTVAEVMDDFEETISSNSNRESNATVDNTEISLGNLQINEITTGGSSSSGTSNVVQYEGYNVVGTIEIPAIDLKYPILERTTPDSIELAVAILYTANGFDGPLPEGYEYVGEVKEVDNKHEPAFDWCGSRVETGQRIYASKRHSCPFSRVLFNMDPSQLFNTWLITPTNHPSTRTF